MSRVTCHVSGDSSAERRGTRSEVSRLRCLAASVTFDMPYSLLPLQMP